MSRPQRLLPNLLLSAAVSALFLGALEGVCRLIEARHPPAAVASYIWDWEERWEKDFYTVSSDAVGWPPSEEFNGDGLRDRSHGQEKPKGVKRLACLGDSVTMGAGIAPAEAFPQTLQTLLDEAGRPIEVLNVALWGWSTRQEAIAYRTIARGYAPDAVVLGVCLNDIPELQNNLTRPPRLLAALHERSALVRRLVNARGREIGSVEEMFREPDAPRVREALERFFAEVRGLEAAVRADGATLTVLVFPFRFQLEPRAPAPVVQERIAAFCKAEGLRCLDLLPALARAGEGSFLDYDHVTAAGARVVAEEIMASGLLPETVSAPEVLARAGVSTPADGLRHPDAGVRAAAAWALSRKGAPAAVPALAAALRDDDEAVRAGAARALGEAGAAAADARPALFTALGDPREGVRRAAAEALFAIGVAAPEWLARLSAALASPDAYVRGFAAWTLGEIGPPAEAAVPALVAALAQDEAYGRGGAAAALAKMGPLARRAVPALVTALGADDARKRWNAARALGRIGPEAAEAVPALTRALADADGRVRTHAARALGRIGAAARDAIPALRTAARDDDRSVRKEARGALEKLGAR